MVIVVYISRCMLLCTAGNIGPFKHFSGLNYEADVTLQWCDREYKASYMTDKSVGLVDDHWIPYIKRWIALPCCIVTQTSPANYHSDRSYIVLTYEWPQKTLNSSWGPSTPQLNTMCRPVHLSVAYFYFTSNILSLLRSRWPPRPPLWPCDLIGDLDNSSWFKTALWRIPLVHANVMINDNIHPTRCCFFHHRGKGCHFVNNLCFMLRHLFPFSTVLSIFVYNLPNLDTCPELMIIWPMPCTLWTGKQPLWYPLCNNSCWFAFEVQTTAFQF